MAFLVRESHLSHWQCYTDSDLLHIKAVYLREERFLAN